MLWIIMLMTDNDQGQFYKLVRCFCPHIVIFMLLQDYLKQDQPHSVQDKKQTEDMMKNL